MIIVSNILYSRTENFDYRWIFYNNNISTELKTMMMKDYKEFEIQKNLFFNENDHIIFHNDNKSGMIFLRFLKMAFTDNFGRSIYGLNGVFLDISLIQLVKALFPAFIVYMINYCKNSSKFNKLDDELDEPKKLLKPLSLDSIWQYYNETKKEHEMILRHINSYHQKTENINDFYFPVLQSPPMLNNFLTNQQQNKVNNFSNPNINTFDYQKIDNYFNHNKYHYKITQYCPKCKQKGNFKIIDLNKNGEIIENAYGIIHMFTKKKETGLIAGECPFCSTKYIIKKESKFIDEWL